ncbi:MAG: hypothetical protein ACE15F_22150 [bacterium]
MPALEKYTMWNWIRPVVWSGLAVLVCGLQGCFTSQPQGPISVGLGRENLRQPLLASEEMMPQPRHFESNLPLGIGARIDLFVSDRAEDINDLYQSYVRPIQKGKIFNRRPYQLDYSILPKKGEAFEEKGSLLNSLSIKSDYAIQIGMSRRFSDFSDFLKPSFWLGLDRFAPTPQEPVVVRKPDTVQAELSSPETNLPPDGHPLVDFNLDELTESRWGLREP